MDKARELLKKFAIEQFESDNSMSASNTEIIFDIATHQLHLQTKPLIENGELVVKRLASCSVKLDVSEHVNVDKEIAKIIKEKTKGAVKVDEKVDTKTNS